MTPGTHPQRVRRNMIRNEPKPLSITARGGKKMQTRTLKIPISVKSEPKLEVTDIKVNQGLSDAMFN